MASETKVPSEADKNKNAIVVKKYANRRLYNTATSSYVTLDDLADMVKEGADFVVYDAKSGEDITRSVLTQIIFEQEARSGADTLLPTTFLRQLIRYYGDNMQAFVPTYLEASLEAFARQQDTIRERFSDAWSSPTAAMEAFREQAMRNMAMFQEATRMLTPFGADDDTEAAKDTKPGTSHGDQLDVLREQMRAMQAQLEALSGNKK